MRVLNSYNAAASVFLAFIAIIYFLTLPASVQSGDTGELVTNAYYLRVSHPPGYPLWHILYHVPVKYFNLGTPFWMASLVTTLLMLISYSLLLFNFKKFETIGIVAVLATVTVIWRYSLLPDVFALHVLFLTLVFLVFMKPHLLNKWWMLLAISLSIAHHHTIVFVFPLFLYALLESGLTLKKVLQCFFFGMLSFLIYFTLLFFKLFDN